MSKTETAEASSLSAKLFALRDTITDRVDGVADSGKAILATRRDERRRDELLKELGALHHAVATGGELDLPTAERITAEITAIDATEDPEADDVEG